MAFGALALWEGYFKLSGVSISPALQVLHFFFELCFWSLRGIITLTMCGIPNSTQALFVVI